MSVTEVLALFGGLLTAIFGTLTGVLAWYRIEERKEKDYIVGRYKDYIEQQDKRVNKIKEEHDADVEKVYDLERKFLSCREDQAKNNERIRDLEAQLAEARRRP